MKIDETTVACIREFVDNKRKEKEILNQIIRVYCIILFFRR